MSDVLQLDSMDKDTLYKEYDNQDSYIGSFLLMKNLFFNQDLPNYHWSKLNRVSILIVEKNENLGKNINFGSAYGESIGSALLAIKDLFIWASAFFVDSDFVHMQINRNGTVSISKLSDLRAVIK